MSKDYSRNFGRRMRDAIRERSSRVVLALDVLDEQEAYRVLDAVHPHLAAVKVNYPLFLSVGREAVGRMIEHYDLPFIGDFKIADIDATNAKICEIMYDVGFDALIAHSVVGRQGALDAVLDAAAHHGRGVILVTSMSHPGAKEFMPPYEDTARFARELGVDGVIAPATRTEEVTAIRRIVGEDTLILSPGVGAQGGKAKDTLDAGADALIVGRSIYGADDPEAAARRLAEVV